MNIKQIVVVSGYFDPIHVGHLEYIEKASKLGDHLIIIVNNDLQAKLKKGKSFMEEKDRKTIVESLKWGDEVIMCIDTDNSTCSTLELIRTKYPYDEIMICNGGDRHVGEVPESKVAKELDMRMVDGLGNKIRSSSELTGIKEVK
tara:strand:+ start:2628 stop:3062 length:435 start_codon:yes stop_codon:yes gene_type:complete